MQPWEFHPAVVHFPVAFLLAAAFFDAWLLARRERGPSKTVAGLLLAGVITGLLSAALGWLAFWTVPAHTDEAHRRMYWHQAVALATLVVATPVAISRWRARNRPPMPWARAGTLAAGVLVGVTGYLGGHLVMRGGAGVDPAILSAELRAGHSHGDAAASDHHGSKPATHGGPGMVPAAPRPLGAAVAPRSPGHRHAPGAGASPHPHH